MNRDVTVLRGRTAEKSTLPDGLALRVLLAKHFGFDLPEAETMRVPSVRTGDEPAFASGLCV